VSLEAAPFSLGSATYFRQRFAFRIATLRMSRNVSFATVSVNATEPRFNWALHALKKDMREYSSVPHTTRQVPEHSLVPRGISSDSRPDKPARAS